MKSQITQQSITAVDRVYYTGAATGDVLMDLSVFQSSIIANALCLVKALNLAVPLIKAALCCSFERRDMDGCASLLWLSDFKKCCASSALSRIANKSPQY